MKTLLTIIMTMALAQLSLAAGPQASQATLYLLNNSWTSKSIRFEKQKLSESVFGLSATLSTSDRFTFEIDGTLANAKLKTSDLKLSSMNDTRVAATIFSAAGLTSFTAYANLPTGKTKLDEEQYAVASSVADNSRKFAVRRFGQGLDIGAEGMVHPSAGDLDFHLGAGYLLKGKFQARKSDTEKYKFGDEISAMAGFGYHQDRIAFMLDGAFIYYMKDKVGDDEVFQAGAATMIHGSVSYSDIFTVTTGVAILMRGKGKVQDASSGADLVEEAERSGRNEFLWFGGLGYPIGEKLRLNGRLEYQNFSANDYAEDNPLFRPKSNYFGIGGGGSYALTENLFASSMITLYSGKIKSELVGGEVDLSGLGLVFALTFRVM